RVLPDDLLGLRIDALDLVAHRREELALVDERPRTLVRPAAVDRGLAKVPRREPQVGGGRGVRKADAGIALLVEGFQLRGRTAFVGVEIICGAAGAGDYAARGAGLARRAGAGGPSG